MTTKNCANVPKLVPKDLCENSFVQNVLYSLSAVHIRVKSIIQISYSGLICTCKYHMLAQRLQNRWAEVPFALTS